jgi:hypothetical protein
MSAAFFKTERDKLNAFRQDVRTVRSGNAVVHPESHGLNLFSVKDQLTVGCKVSVWRWASKSLKSGVVTQVHPAEYEIQYEDVDLEREWISDLDVAPHCSEESSLKVVTDHPALDITMGLSPLVQNLSDSPIGAVKRGRHYSDQELQLVAQLARINRMKTTVLQAIESFHDFAEKGKKNIVVLVLFFLVFLNGLLSL